MKMTKLYFTFSGAISNLVPILSFSHLSFSLVVLSFVNNLHILLHHLVMDLDLDLVMEQGSELDSEQVLGSGQVLEWVLGPELGLELKWVSVSVLLTLTLVWMLLMNF